MIPAAFDYAAPSSIEEALGLLQQHGDEAKLLAGGHSLLPLMKLRLAAPGILVDLGRIPNLSYIRDAGDHVAIGPMTTEYLLETSSLLKQRIPLLAQAAGLVGDMQVRNRGTIGGSVAHADPASDLPTIVMALGAQIVATGPNGERTIAADGFFEDIWTSVLQPDEIITEIRVPYGQGQPAQDYQKFRQRASDWAIVGVAVSVTRQNGGIGSASVVLTNVGSTPIRASGVENALRGQQATADNIRSASQHASEGLNPSPELKASPDYKRHLAQVMTRRALETALGVK
ncbi:MAG: xanthine dehydrogenase family protein subunit M [Chloroflexota bacterium]|nr:xanthine dehydrogenase family protein subunit M [Chloroflexota bacterium]